VKPSNDFDTLVRELSRWNGGRGIDIDSWLSCVGSFELAIAFARLFWPAFVEHDGCVLFEGFSEASYTEFLEQTDGDRAAVEAVMNHRHIGDLFCGPDLEPTHAQLRHLGRVLVETWTAKLARDFPERRFSVTFPERELDELLDYEITFSQR
jgi:hypothetical protein